MLLVDPYEVTGGSVFAGSGGVCGVFRCERHVVGWRQGGAVAQEHGPDRGAGRRRAAAAVWGGGRRGWDGLGNGGAERGRWRGVVGQASTRSASPRSRLESGDAKRR